VIEQILQADRLLQVDQVDKARDMYQRVVDLDPGNAIAVVGLAQCALADADDRGAYELAARALEIDPENDMARRMEARLAEVLTVRGEHVERPDAAKTPGSKEMRPMVTEMDRAEADAGTSGPAAGEPAKTPGPDTSTAPASSSPEPAPTAQRKSFLDRLMGR
jgi:tetratricopeptide (TPR) repeat protein